LQSFTRFGSTWWWNVSFDSASCAVPQRTWQIWSFAFVFFVKYWLQGKKWSYGRKGMTEARVTERKTKLAVWLREGLVKLGPTFIKVRLPMLMPIDHHSPSLQSRAMLLHACCLLVDARHSHCLWTRRLVSSFPPVSTC